MYPTIRICTIRLSLWTVLCFTAVAGDSGGDANTPIKLLPNVLMSHLSMLPAQTMYFRGLNLDPNTRYEVRISHPATYPTDFTLQLVQGCEYMISSPVMGRQLHNIDKIEIDISDIGDTKQKGSAFECLIEVTTNLTGVPIDEQLNSRPVVFNIVIQSLVLGIPSDAIPLISLTAACVVITVLGLYYLYFKKLALEEKRSS